MAAPERVGFAPPAAPAVARFSLQAPPQVAPGQEFTVQLGMESAAALRGGAIAIAYDGTRLRFVRAEAGDLLSAAGGDAALRASADAAGRLSLAFQAKGDVQGSGTVARLVFQTPEEARGSLELRFESLAVTDPAGRVLPTQTLAPPRFSIQP
jgi:hypothetical protein